MNEVFSGVLLKMDDFSKIEKKLKQPPSAPNWVRYNHSTQDKTTKAIAQFALGFPRSALFKVYRIVADMVVWNTPLEDALKSVSLIRDPLTAQLGKEIVTAFAGYISDTPLDGLEIFEETVGFFRVSRDVSVPVKPTFVILKDEKPTPVFLIGWTNMPFTEHQKRLLTTLIDDALLSLSDFSQSDALIISVPRVGNGCRQVLAWSTSQFPRLSATALAEQLSRYETGLSEALPLVKSELSRRATLRQSSTDTRKDQRPSRDDEQPGLFD